MNTSKFIDKALKSYALYVCQQRGIPSLTDGLKPSQRKAIFSLGQKTSKIKTISLAGEMISNNIYLHGDISAAETISHMAAPYVNNLPLIEGEGNFGSKLTPNDFGAPRYTYVRSNDITKKFFGIDLDIIPMQDNYDGSTSEPKHYLPLIPVCLINGSEGIAFGWSTYILPRNPKKLIKAAINILNNKKCNNLLDPYWNNFDIEINKLDNSWLIKGKVEIINNYTCLIKELPPNMKVTSLRKRLNILIEEEKIVDYNDNSTSDINIEIIFKRGSLKDWNEDKLIELFKLKSKETENLVVLNLDDRIQYYDDVEILLKDFVDWRLKYYLNRYSHYHYVDSDKLKFCLAIEELFKKKFPETLPYKSKKEMMEAIGNLVSLSEDEISSIVNFPTYNWTSEYRGKNLEKIKQLQENLLLWESFINDPEKRKKQ